MWSVLNCLDILSEDKDAATSSTADSLLKNIFCFNFVLGIMVPNSVLISIVYLHLLSTAVPAAAAHLPRAQPEVGAGRGGDQPVRGGDTLGCRVSATMVAVWMLCEKYRFDLANLASVPTSLVLFPSLLAREANLTKKWLKLNQRAGHSLIRFDKYKVGV